MKKKILIVDPAADLRQLLAVRLELLGWDVLQAGDSKEASLHLKEKTPDLVVTEWSLSGVEGAELVSLLEPRKRPVLLYTDHEETDPHSFLKRTGARVFIPKRKRSELLELVQSLSSEGGSTDVKTGTGKQVLLIEDSPLVRNFVRKAFEQFLPGCVVREAVEGRAAMSEMSQKKVDLIVSDLEMPGMDGPTFLRHIRSNPVLKTKPIIVLSSSITPELKEEFKGDTRLAFLAKPSTPGEIAEAARCFLGQS